MYLLIRYYFHNQVHFMPLTTNTKNTRKLVLVTSIIIQATMQACIIVLLYHIPIRIRIRRKKIAYFYCSGISALNVIEILTKQWQ